jgi:excinuclease ABC subunit B
MYSDVVTESMRIALDETNRRREIQKHYNQHAGITPQSVRKNILDLSAQLYRMDSYTVPQAAEGGDRLLSKEEIRDLISEFTRSMRQAADEMEFERAAELRDKLTLLKEMELGLQPASQALLEAPQRREEKPRIRKGPPARLRRRR